MILLDFVAANNCMYISVYISEAYKKSFLGRISDGPGWCDDRQSMRLPLSLTGVGKATKANRLLGDRPKTIVAFNS
jgi:hypothetical protein